MRLVIVLIVSMFGSIVSVMAKPYVFFLEDRAHTLSSYCKRPKHCIAVAIARARSNLDPISFLFYQDQLSAWLDNRSLRQYMSDRHNNMGHSLEIVHASHHKFTF
jgi:hypothetical protein